MDYGFKNVDLNRIEIRASVDNSKSQAIPEKLKFIKEGVLRQAEFVNNHLYRTYSHIFPESHRLFALKSGYQNCKK